MNLRRVVASCRDHARVMRKVKTGVMEFRITASPASMEVSAQATRVKGRTLLRQAWMVKFRQVSRSRGRRIPRRCMIRARMLPAISVRAAIRVMGGMVSTPILMKV